MKCANCNNDALYEYKLSQADSIFYCGKDLPKFLDERRRAGLLTMTAQHVENQESALKAISIQPSAVKPEAEETTTKKRSKKQTNK